MKRVICFLLLALSLLAKTNAGFCAGHAYWKDLGGSWTECPKLGR
jgi:hypothetical protein